MCLQLTVLGCCPTSFGVFRLLIQYCIFCPIVLFHFRVDSSFSQVCLLEWGIAFKFWFGVCPIAPSFEHVRAGGGG